MKWLMWLIIAWLVLRAPPLGVSLVVFYALLLFAKRLSKPGVKDESDREMPEDDRTSRPPQFGVSFGQLADLLVLRRELNHLLANKRIDADSHRRLVLEIDKLEDRFFADHGVLPDNDLWRERKEAAWDQLNAHAEEPLGPVPWRRFGGDVSDPAPASATVDRDLAIEYTAQNIDAKSGVQSLAIPPEMPTEVSTSRAESAGLASPKFELTLEAIEPETETRDAPVLVPQDAFRSSNQAFANANQTELPAAAVAHSMPAVRPPPDIENYAWQRHEPGPLEKALKTLSGWHALAAPFLVQNIGWFIGVFLFIAGSIFLVSYSTGYLKSLIVFLTFFIFTLFLLWGGYQLRSKRPDLATSSDVVLILSLLMVPLTTATVTRLLISSETALLKIVSGLLAGVELAAFYLAATMVSALMDRSLQGKLPKLFLALTFLQLLLAMLNAFPYWPLLALCHVMLLALLGIGIRRFVSDWLHSIFVDQRKIAYFAAGMLIYAALVSFVHLTYGADSEIRLPPGYFGPFLMILCGLLFYVDAQFKQWTETNPTLSRFSFFVYGVSLLALYWVAGGQIAAYVTLVLAIALYALVIWHYLTLTPLYLFLGCCFWLYHLAVLRHVPDAGYFLAALPGLAGLYRLACWSAFRRRSAYLPLIVFRMLYALAALLTLWTLGRSEPGMLSMASVLASGVLFYFALKSAPEYLFTPREQMPEVYNPSRYRNLLDSAWFYLLPALAAAAAYFAPPFSSLDSKVQFAFAALPIVGFWGATGLILFARQLASGPVPFIERHCNAALLTLAAAALPIFLMSRSEQALWLGLAGSILLWFSLKLEARWLFYLMLGCLGSAAVICKLTYFPWPTTGLTHMGLAIGLWVFLKYLQFLDRLPSAALRREQAALRAGLRPSLKLLWCFPVNPKSGAEQDA